SHDVRTPLTAIMGLSEILEDARDEEQRAMGEEIKNSCKHLIYTLDSVLHLSQMQRGQLKLSLAPVELDQVVREACAAFQPTRAQDEAEPRIHIETPEEGLQVVAEHGALLRVLSNLIGNALKFCPDAPVYLRTFVESNQARIEIEDSGPGISKEFIEEIFKPFTQEANALSSSLPGSGLGLSICHELVQLMDGSIEVESEPGKGTKMIVRLPLCRKESLTAGKTPDPQSPKPVITRTMICDDHEATCKVIRRMLRDHDVIVVGSEEQIHEHLDEVDVLLLDINLHGKHRGIEIMKNLRQNPKYRKLRIIAFTAHALASQKESFIEEGFDDYMSKPFRKHDLIEKIRSAPGK
ncbi:MAG TPA: hybrid sensor histidine kinase/response regulator, partial [Opitutales bacterium]|nr:hybrid sensor histidine kinase/response regulator [Opitutales bacterium]